MTDSLVQVGEVHIPSSPPVAGVCCGFEVRSSIAFNYLRPGSGDRLDVLETQQDQPDPIGELISEAAPRQGPGSVDVYRAGPVFNIDVDYGGWFRVHPAKPSISIPRSQHPLWREAVIWGLPLALCLLEKGRLVLHSAAVEIDGKAVVFGAPGGSGKTTLTAAFLRKGFRMLTEDLTACRIGPKPAAFPGPTLLRLRRDAAARVNIEGAELVAEDQEKVHLAVEPELTGDGNALPLGAVVLLREAPSSVRLSRAAPQRTIPDLWRLALNLPEEAGRRRCFLQVSELAATVPIWNLERPLRYDALDRVVETIVAQPLFV